ncbi:MAG: SMC-Scp complex subunit ScpB [Candidatus Uhrbacteria bacterium]|nr:SMC-Scp complex subunit ScpB [Candidatus Uhrbacteria bacterium]
MLTTTIEAVLFAAAKPIKLSDLRKHLDVSEEVVREAIDDIVARFNVDASGIHLMEQNGSVQLVSNAHVGEAVAKFLKKEASGPLTRPSLETLTIIVYRGPITKPEIEMIRGVNCSLILRNLLIRGFVTEKQDKARLQPVYHVSHEFLQAIGVNRLDALPDYEAFRTNEKITELLSREPDTHEV